MQISCEALIVQGFSCRSSIKYNGFEKDPLEDTMGFTSNFIRITRDPRTGGAARGESRGRGAARGESRGRGKRKLMGRLRIAILVV